MSFLSHEIHYSQDSRGRRRSFFHEHWHISRTITADRSPLYIASGFTEAGIQLFLSANRVPLSYGPSSRNQNFDNSVSLNNMRYFTRHDTVERKRNKISKTIGPRKKSKTKTTTKWHCNSLNLRQTLSSTLLEFTQ